MKIMHLNWFAIIIPIDEQNKWRAGKNDINNGGEIGSFNICELKTVCKLFLNLIKERCWDQVKRARK